MKNRIAFIALIFTLGLFGMRPVLAEDEPAPGVARVSLIHGDVSTMRGDSGDWVATTVNAPLVRGDKIATDGRSRVEVQLDHANILRLDQHTEAKIADLTRTRIQVQLARGTVNFTVLKGTEADVEIDTPNVSVRPIGEGSYRIQVNAESETEVTVRKGEAEVTTPRGSTTVEEGQLITVQGLDDPQYQIAKAPHRDEWEQWNKDRDREIREASSWRYANRYYTGAHDLDRYGHWVYVPDYDWCWTPYVNAGWVPYRDGRWVWEPYWGWTWVSYEPWGWAPYHYGRWFYYGNSWRWWPGYGLAGYGHYSHFGFYPTWAPAYVSFLGFGFGGRSWHFGFGFGYSSIGWCPLGPYDSFYPWWGFRNSYNVVNITNITNIRNITKVTNVQNGGAVTAAVARGNGSNIQAALANARVRGAITTVSTEDFVRGRVPRNPRPVDAGTLRQAHVVQGTLPAVPTRDSLRPVNRPASPAVISTARANPDRFFSRSATPGSPERFSERAAAIQEMVERHNPLAAGRNRDQAPQASSSVARTTPRADFAAGSTNRGIQPSAHGAPQPAERSDWLRFNRLGAIGSSESGSRPAPDREATAQKAPTTGAGEKPQVEPAGRTERPWQQFGTGNAGPIPGREAPAAPTGEIRPREEMRRPAAPNETATPDSRMPENRRWQRFGTGNARPAPRSGAPAELGPASGSTSTPREAMRPQGQPAPGSFADPAMRDGWRRFSSTPRPDRPAPAESSPRESAAPRSFPARPSPSTGAPQSGPSDGWRQFSREARPAPAERGPAFSAPRSESPRGEQPGWNRFPSRQESTPPARTWGGGAPRESMRFPSRSEGPVFRDAPRTSARPPLEIQRPIVVERAPRGFDRGGPARGAWGGGRAPSAPPASSAPRQPDRHSRR